MTDQIVMYDAIADDQFPAGAAAYAGYADGDLDNQPNYNYIVATYPAAEHVGIALNAATTFDAAVRHRALDVENGAAAPADIPGWYAAQVAQGIDRPIVYASAWTMQARILPILKAAGIGYQQVRKWAAHYDAGPHICGPGTCRELDTDADATQWTPNALERDLDASLLLAGFFGELPADWTYGPPAALSANGGHTSVKLEWQPPQGYPVAPSAYKIWVYRGTRASATTLVPTYPRTPAFRRTATGLEWEGGSLERGKVYTAHVAAMGPPENTRMRPWTFAAALFKTG